MTPSRRSGVGRASIAVRTASTAAACSSLSVESTGWAPRRPAGRAASGRRGRSRISVRARPRRTSPAIALPPWRPDSSGPGKPLGGGRPASALLARAERASTTAAGSAAGASRVGRQDPAFEARPGPGRRQRPVDRHQPVRLERAEPAEQARTALRCGEVPGGPRPGGELVEQIGVTTSMPRSVGACRRPLDDQLEPFEHPWREHRPEDQGRRDEVVSGDPAREREGQVAAAARRRAPAPPAASPRCPWVRSRRPARRPGPGGGRTRRSRPRRLRHPRLVRHRVRVRPHATGPAASIATSTKRPVRPRPLRRPRSRDRARAPP